MREFIATVTSNGRITIPLEVRRYLGVSPSDKVVFAFQSDGRIEVRAPRFTIASLRGVVPPLSGRETVDFEDQIAEAFDETI